MKEAAKNPEKWELSPPYGVKTVLVVIAVFIFLSFSARHSDIDKMFYMLGEAGGKILGLTDSSQVVSGTGRVIDSMFPLRISEETPVARIENFDRDNLPFFSRVEIETIEVSRFNVQSMQLEVTEQSREILVEPVGYVLYAMKKMVETIEIALWATIFAIIISIPLAYYSASNYSPNRLTYGTSRSLVSFFRAVPELISAMFLVLAFGFGPIAGILALGIHSAGFLGKFYAEDIENADRGPQEALQAIGASKIKMLRYAVLPQVLPQYLAYSMYILDRNVRMATVVGIVGAGGIGQELKGRYDMFDYGHVGTILLLIFITVLLLDQIASRIRARLI